MSRSYNVLAFRCHCLVRFWGGFQVSRSCNVLAFRCHGLVRFCGLSIVKVWSVFGRLSGVTVLQCFGFQLSLFAPLLGGALTCHGPVVFWLSGVTVWSAFAGFQVSRSCNVLALNCFWGALSRYIRVSRLGPFWRLSGVMVWSALGGAFRLAFCILGVRFFFWGGSYDMD